MSYFHWGKYGCNYLFEWQQIRILASICFNTSLAACANVNVFPVPKGPTMSKGGSVRSGLASISRTASFCFSFRRFVAPGSTRSGMPRLVERGKISYYIFNRSGKNIAMINNVKNITFINNIVYYNTHTTRSSHFYSTKIF